MAREGVPVTHYNSRASWITNLTSIVAILSFSRLDKSEREKTVLHSLFNHFSATGYLKKPVLHSATRRRDNGVITFLSCKKKKNNASKPYQIEVIRNRRGLTHY